MTYAVLRPGVQLFVHLRGREAVQLDKQQEVDELSIIGTVGGINRAELQTVKLTELNRQRPLLSCLVGRPAHTHTNIYSVKFPSQNSPERTDPSFTCKCSSALSCLSLQLLGSQSTLLLVQAPPPLALRL